MGDGSTLKSGYCKTSEWGQDVDLEGYDFNAIYGSKNLLNN